jgi:uncharacterized membrane protein YsdA (DUF1294 family)
MPFPTLLSLCAMLSIATFFVYAIDKKAARNGQWRIPESLLHLLALLGGWPGALAAQSILRHKWRKHRFMRVFWLTVGLNLGFLWWLHR